VLCRAGEARGKKLASEKRGIEQHGRNKKCKVGKLTGKKKGWFSKKKKKKKLISAGGTPNASKKAVWGLGSKKQPGGMKGLKTVRKIGTGVCRITLQDCEKQEMFTAMGIDGESAFNNWGAGKKDCLDRGRLKKERRGGVVKRCGEKRKGLPRRESLPEPLGGKERTKRGKNPGPGWRKLPAKEAEDDRQAEKAKR